MKLLKLKTAAIALTSWCLATSANALVITDSQSFNTYNSAYTSTRGSYSSYGDTVFKNISLDGFDSSLGTLTSVSISLNSYWTSHTKGHAVDKKGRRNDTWMRGYGYSNYSIALVDPWGASPLARTSRNQVSCHSRGWGFEACYDGEYDRGSFNTTLNVSSIDLNQFLNDDITLRLGNYQRSVLHCDNNDRGDLCSLNTKGTWKGKVTVAYHYAVPTAGSFGLLAAGLAGLLMIRRRKTA